MIACAIDELLKVPCFLRVFYAAQFPYFVDDLVDGMHDFVCMCYRGVGDAFVLEGGGVGESFFLGCFDVANMCAIVIR